MLGICDGCKSTMGRRDGHMRRVASEVDHSSTIELRAPSWVSRGPYRDTRHEWRLLLVQLSTYVLAVSVFKAHAVTTVPAMCSKPMSHVYRTEIRRVGPRRNRGLELTDRRGRPTPPAPAPHQRRLKRPGPAATPPAAPQRTQEHNPRSAIISTYAHKYAQCHAGGRAPPATEHRMATA